MIILVILVHLSLSMIFPIGRVALTVSYPLFFTAARMLLGGLILSGYSLLVSGGFKIERAAWIPIVAFAITGIFITNACEFWGLQYMSAAKAAFIYTLSPFAAALFSYFFFNEKMSVAKVVGMAIGLVGFGIMITSHAPDDFSFHAIGAVSLAEIALLSSAIASAIGWIVLRRYVKKSGSSTQELLTASMILGGFFCLASSFLAEPWDPLPLRAEHFSFSTFSITLLAAMACSNLIGYALYTYLLRTYTATFLSFAGFVEPIFAAFFAWLYLGEQITCYFLLSMLLVLIGLYIFYMEELRMGYIILPPKK